MLAIIDKMHFKQNMQNFLFVKSIEIRYYAKIKKGETWSDLRPAPSLARKFQNHITMGRRTNIQN